MFSMSNSNCCFMTHIQETGKVVWCSYLFKKFPQFVVIHAVKSFSTVNEAEVELFPECLCILHDQTKAGNPVSSSSAYSKPSLNTWRCSAQILLKHTLNDFKHNLASTWNDCNSTVVWTFFAIALLLDWSETDLFQSCLVSQFCGHIEGSTSTASSFRIWNTSAGIPLPLPLLIAMLPKANLTSHSKMSSFRWVTTSWLLGS